MEQFERRDLPPHSPTLMQRQSPTYLEGVFSRLIQLQRTWQETTQLSPNIGIAAPLLLLLKCPMKAWRKPRRKGLRKPPRPATQNNNQLKSAIFVQQHIVMLIGVHVYIYYPNQKSWTPAEGIKTEVNGISTYQCCINQEPFCETTSSLVVAYQKGVVKSEIIIFLSKDGGLHFQQMRPIMLSKCAWEWVKMNRIYYPAVYSNLTSNDFDMSSGDTVPSVIQPTGMRGHIVIWSQNVYPVRVQMNRERKDNLLNEQQTIDQVVTNDSNEIAVMTSDGLIYFGILDMDALVVMIKKVTPSIDGLLMFDKNGDLVILNTRSGYFDGTTDFLHCTIQISHAINNLTVPLQACMMETLQSEFQNRVYYIDMNESFNMSATFVPKPGTSTRCLVMVTNPDLVSFQATVNVFGKTIDDNWVFKMDIFLTLLPTSETVDYYLQERRLWKVSENIIQLGNISGPEDISKVEEVDSTIKNPP
ncbi:cation channel sperm-associated auxiliary subunit delta-like [Mustelus asterias]